MKDQLIKKLLLWTPDLANKFHSYTTRDNIEGCYIWDRADNGVFLYRNTGVHFCSNAGKIYVLTSRGKETDWNSHLQLYNMLKESKSSCRIDIPIFQETVIINGVLYFYKEFSRPGNEYGRDYHLDILDNKVNDQYFSKYIDDAAILISNLKSLHIKSKQLMPNVGLSTFKRLTDSRGIFWIDFKAWDLPFNKFLEVSLTTLDVSIWYLEYNEIGKYNRSLLVKEAEQKWNLI
jgi:hypothetical protein